MYVRGFDPPSICSFQKTGLQPAKDTQILLEEVIQLTKPKGIIVGLNQCSHSND